MRPWLDRVIAGVSAVVGEGPKELHVPLLTTLDSQSVADAVASGWVSSAGPKVVEFEQRLGEFIGASEVVATCSGTSALEIALRSLGVGPEDEVLVPPLSFVATVNSVLHVGASPHFVDIEADTFGIDPSALERWLLEIATSKGNQCFNKVTGRRIAAVVPVHVFGHACRIQEIVRVARDFHLKVVEDAAEALGSERDGVHVGLGGDAGVFSFNGNKIITTGGGGAVVTDASETANVARHLATTAKLPHPYVYHHDQMGFNYRMPNLNAALGVSQLSKIHSLLRAKRELTLRYAEAFLDIPEVVLKTEPHDTRSNYWLQTLVLPDSRDNLRNRLLDRFHEIKIMARPAWDNLNTLPYLRKSPKADLRVANSFIGRLVNIPSSAQLGLAPERPNE